jgi:hypothetical protein
VDVTITTPGTSMMSATSPLSGRAGLTDLAEELGRRCDEACRSMRHLGLSCE